MKKGGLQELALRREFVQRLDSAKRDDLRKAVWIAVATLERIGKFRNQLNAAASFQAAEANDAMRDIRALVMPVEVP